MKAKELETVLWRATTIGFGMLIISFLMMWGCRDFVTFIYSHIFPDLTPADMASNIYLMYGGMKILLFVFFLIPALALMWQRKARS